MFAKNDITKESLKNDVKSRIEDIATTRRMWYEVLKEDISELDEFIANCSREEFEKVDNFSESEFTMYMINNIMGAMAKFKGKVENADE